MRKFIPVGRLSLCLLYVIGFRLCFLCLVFVFLKFLPVFVVFGVFWRVFLLRKVIFFPLFKRVWLDFSQNYLTI